MKMTDYIRIKYAGYYFEYTKYDVNPSVYYDKPVLDDIREVLDKRAWNIQELNLCYINLRYEFSEYYDNDFEIIRKELIELEEKLETEYRFQFGESGYFRLTPRNKYLEEPAYEEQMDEICTKCGRIIPRVERRIYIDRGLGVIQNGGRVDEGAAVHRYCPYCEENGLISYAKLFEKYPPLLIDISLYGSCEDTYYRVTGVTGMYNRVISNIKKLLKAGIRVSIKAPVLSVYFNELPKIKAIAEDFKIPFRTGFEIFPTIDNDKSVQNYSVSIVEALKYEFEEFDKRPRTFGSEYEVELVNLKKQRPLFRCKLGRASCVIDYEGKMCPCMSFRHIGKKLTRDNFDEIWNSFGTFPGMKASEDYKCLDCEAYDFCDICPAMMQFVYGDLEYVDTHFCKRAQARYKYYIEHKCMEEIIDGLK